MANSKLGLDSSTLGWHTFPFPPLTETQKDRLGNSAREILLAREAHYPKTIGELYSKGKLPPDLRAAHTKNDELLESFFREKRFTSDDDRLSHLFARYAEMTKGKSK